MINNNSVPRYFSLNTNCMFRPKHSLWSLDKIRHPTGNQVRETNRNKFPDCRSLELISTVVHLWNICYVVFLIFCCLFSVSQHDISETRLKSALDGVVEDCVSFVGADLNVCNEVLLRWECANVPCLLPCRMINCFHTEMAWLFISLIWLYRGTDLPPTDCLYAPPVCGIFYLLKILLFIMIE